MFRMRFKLAGALLFRQARVVCLRFQSLMAVKANGTFLVRAVRWACPRNTRVKIFRASFADGSVRSHVPPQSTHVHPSGLPVISDPASS